MGFDYRTYTGHGKQTLGGHTHKKACVHQDPDPTEIELDQSFKCLSVSHGGTGHWWLAAWAGALGAADLGDTACGLLEEVSINPTIELQADDPHTAE